jgi:mRNA interferase MazF
MSKKVSRGEIYWVDWDPGRGSEQQGRRPALIIQNDVGNERSPTTIVAACSTAPEKPFPFIVPITKKDSGLPKDTNINLAIIMTIDKLRLLDRAGELNQEKMDEVDQAIKTSLSLQ